MKQNFVYLLLTICMLFTAVLPAGADYLPLYDEPDLLTDAEESALINRLESIGYEYQMEVVVAVVESAGEYSAMEYADDFYDYNGYGYGETHDGLILMVVMDTHDWWISTCGEAIQVFTDAGISYIGEQIVPYMSDGDFNGAFLAFADQCESFMEQARNGEAFDTSNLPKEPFAAGTSLIIALVIGFIIGLIYTGNLKGQLKSVQAQRAAAGYVKNGSLQITNSRDFFLYRHVNKTEKQTESSSSGGGSTTHTSSSGRSHGGGGGKF